MADTGGADKDDAVPGGTGGAGGFVFGQRMEERVVKSDTASTPGRDSNKDTEENGVSSGESPVSVVSRSTSAAKNTTEGPFGATGGASKWAPTANNPSNPFATKHSMSTPNTSDSEDEKRDKPIIAPPSFKVNRVDEKPKSRFFLKPSALDSYTCNKECPSSTTPFRLKPATLKGPEDSVDTESTSDPKGELVSSSSAESNPRSNTAPSESIQDRLFGGKESRTELVFKPLSNTIVKNGSEAPFFGKNLKEKSEVSSSSESGGFVFGQNLEDRITHSDHVIKPVEQQQPTLNTERNSTENTPTKGTAKPESVSPSSKTLVESANEYQAKHAQKHYDEVEVVTGEEGESNVLQIYCKLFVFDNASENWHERGRGLLRLNDRMPAEDGNNVLLQSRVVMRTSGSLRVVLNTQVWSGMMVDRASPNSVRITAQDADSVKVVLLVASPQDMDQVYHALDWRVQQLKRKQEAVAPSSTAESTASQKRKAEHDSDQQEDTQKKPRHSTSIDSDGADTTETDVSQPRTPVTLESEGSNESVPKSSSSTE